MSSQSRTEYLFTTLFRKFNAPRMEGLSEYFDSLQDGFCPFLGPSIKNGATRNSVYTLIGRDHQISESIFYLGLIHTEILRRERLNTDTKSKLLACENLFFRFEQEDNIDGPKLFAWPHWLLKSAYTGVGVMYGKFWKNEVSISRNGIKIPPPPYHMLSVRSLVKVHDRQFFKKAPEFLGQLELAHDNDSQPFDALGLSQTAVDRIVHSGLTPEEMFVELKLTNIFMKAKSMNPRTDS